MMNRLVLTAVLLATPVAAAQSQTTYARTTDTLRFREVTKGDVKLMMPQGEMAMKTDHDATIAVVRLPGDSARAWYESLTLALTGPMGAQAPPTDAALRVPFTLKFDSRGRVKLVSAPKFPSAIEGMTDLSREFDDFFLRLPVTTLRMGLAWTDTATMKDSTAEKVLDGRSIATYRVERDTVVNGTRAFVISMRQQVRLRTDGPVPDQPMRIAATMEGTDDGIVVFAPSPGVLIGRRRTGDMQGDLKMTGPGGEMMMRQAFTYTNTLDAIRK